MLNSKQRAFLRGKANTIESILQVGKGGINDAMIQQAIDALEARELIKGNVLQNSETDAKTIAYSLAEKISAEVVQVIGKRFVLYKESTKNKQIVLPQ